MSEIINRLGDAKNFVSLGYTHSALMAIDDAIKILKAAQAQASKPIAAVHGWFHGECVIRALDPEVVLPAGMALYSQPQAQAVNQQLLEALKSCEQCLTFIHGGEPLRTDIPTVVVCQSSVESH